MVQDCTEPRQYERGKYVQAVEDAHIQINIAEEDTYSDVEGFDIFLIGFKEPINVSGTIDTNITGIKRRIFVGTDEHSFLNKGKNTQGSGKAVGIWWLILDI